jgi:hypothetical protein
LNSQGEKMAKSVAKKSAKSTKKAAKKLTHSEAVQGSNLASGTMGTKTAAPVAEKPAKAAKAATKKAVAVKKAAAPNPLHAALIALMARKDGATISDFQTVEGFNIPSMAALRIAERHGYEATASKKPGERTVYKAVKRAGG